MLVDDFQGQHTKDFFFFYQIGDKGSISFPIKTVA